MARKVFVTSDISHDEKLLDVAEEDPTAALLWPWLLTVFDDWGRARAEPRRLKVQVFPGNDLVTVDVISRTLALLRDASLIVLYGEREEFMAVESETWFRWQTHIRKEKREDDSGSKFPSLPDPREIAQLREESRDRTPSPTPSDREPKGSRNGEIWTAMAEKFGEAKTETEKSGRGKLVRSLSNAEATPEDIQRRARAWDELFPGATLTDFALEKWWGQLGKLLESHSDGYDCESQGHPEDRRVPLEGIEFCGLCRKELA